MRSYSRFTTNLEIICTVEGKEHALGLYNLSSGGCMIEAPDVGDQEGRPIEIALNPKIKVPGHVAWQIDKNMGVKFDIPLHQKVVEHFGYSDEQFDRNDPRDRFGIPLVEVRTTAAGMIE